MNVVLGLIVYNYTIGLRSIHIHTVIVNRLKRNLISICVIMHRGGVEPGIIMSKNRYSSSKEVNVKQNETCLYASFMSMNIILICKHDQQEKDYCFSCNYKWSFQLIHSLVLTCFVEL